MLYMLGGFKRWRRSTLRFQDENARIEEWLARIAQLAVDHYSLAVELARAQKLIKGYGETHERGWRNFTALVRPAGISRDAFGRVRRCCRACKDAALADEEGQGARAGDCGACAVNRPASVSSQAFPRWRTTRPEFCGLSTQ